MSKAINRRRGGGPRALAAVVAAVTRPLFGRRGLADGAIVGDWAAVVGPRLAELSAPERIVYPRGERRQGTLHLRVAGGSLAVELQHLEPLVVERVNGYFGYQAVARLKLIHGPLPAPEPTATPAPRALTPAEDEMLRRLLAGVEDRELQGALESLGRAVRARHPPDPT